MLVALLATVYVSLFAYREITSHLMEGQPVPLDQVSAGPVNVLMVVTVAAVAGPCRESEAAVGARADSKVRVRQARPSAVRS